MKRKYWPSASSPPDGDGRLYSASAFPVRYRAANRRRARAQARSLARKRIRVETVAGNLEVPWLIVFAPDGRMLFTERSGRTRVYENGRLRPEPLALIQDVEPTGESGLMGLTLHPQFAQNRLLYLAYAYRNQKDQLVRVVRYR